ncbi:cytochrome P450 [Haladaptatus caseinilyticus]|uniref:cytochrome P450 n=1 Tax=Haladaptatus caseinilyticus TaxID=2993314 RepID=UPI00224BA177|nr:cytochrome P450 [Haladaptatus caseinilyticus]
MASSDQDGVIQDPLHQPQPEELSTDKAQLRRPSWYAEMRQEQPVRYDEERNRWDVFRYEDVNAILRDHETYTTTFGNTTEGKSMFTEDPPEHGRLRNFASNWFSPRTLREKRPRFEEIADELIDEIEPGNVDIISEFAHPYPVTIIAESLGLPIEDYEQFIEWSDASLRVPPRTDDDEMATPEEQETAIREMSQYFSELVHERADGDGSDLITIAATNDDLSHKEKVTFCHGILVAGNVTTINLITNALWCFEEFDLIDDIRSGAIDRKQAIEEVLRYRSPAQSLVRRTTQPVEIGGKEIRKGELVTAWTGSANHDPATFDAPEEFRPERKPNRHISFGGGIHICLGAPLARLEADIALERLLDRFEVVEPDLSDLSPQATPFGLQSLPCYLEK